MKNQGLDWECGISDFRPRSSLWISNERTFHWWIFENSMWPELKRHIFHLFWGLVLQVSYNDLQC